MWCATTENRYVPRAWALSISTAPPACGVSSDFISNPAVAVGAVAGSVRDPIMYFIIPFQVVKIDNMQFRLPHAPKERTVKE
jgi:hypothetical protein